MHCGVRNEVLEVRDVALDQSTFSFLNLYERLCELRDAVREHAQETHPDEAWRYRALEDALGAQITAIERVTAFGDVERCRRDVAAALEQCVFSAAM